MVTNGVESNCGAYITASLLKKNDFVIVYIRIVSDAAAYAYEASKRD
jgi:hypothetical protein